jgi:hypothetical protein
MHTPNQHLRDHQLAEWTTVGELSGWSVSIGASRKYTHYVKPSRSGPIERICPSLPAQMIPVNDHVDPEP